MNRVKIVYRKLDYSASCYLTEEQLRIFGLDNRPGQIVLTIGSISVVINKVILSANQVGNEVLSFSEDMRCRIYIPDNTELQLKRIGVGHLEIGPIVGVFISSKKAAALSQNGDDSVYQQMNEACKNLNGICAFFSFGDIDWKRMLVKAFIRDDSKWVSSIIPMPTVIYDRCFGKYGRSNGIELREKLGQDYHIINAMTKLGKWETINALKKNEALAALLPETTWYQSRDDLADAVNRLNSVYLKPDLLYKGKGIFRVSKGPGKSFKVEHREEDENQVLYIPGIEYIKDLIDKYVNAGGGYIVQQEISKASFKGYPFDFRLLYQKDWQGLWQPTGISVRMGAPGSIITSPRSGGAVAEFKTVLKETFNEDMETKNGLYEQIITIGRDVAIQIDKEFGDCVELGLDMTIDTNRKVWIIEVNGKPLKVSLKWLNDPELMWRSYKRPLEYSVYLTGFQSAEAVRGL